jgi:hypothetical protein
MASTYYASLSCSACQGTACPGPGVIWSAVIPAKANPIRRQHISKGLRSRFLPPWRGGNDYGLQRPCLANDISTRSSPALKNHGNFPNSRCVLTLRVRR